MGIFRSLSTIPFVASLVLLFSLLPFVTRASSPSLAAAQSAQLNEFQGSSLAMFNTPALAVDDDYTCDADRPCSNSACCGKEGQCGYGPDYCGDGCQSNCDAVAECGEFAEEEGKECPLNVCCSQYGFCGTTTLFCDDKCQSNCGKPEVPGGASSESVLHKVIGYYESWAARRKCQKFTPQQIPISGLTHINFAFAFVEPETYKVVPMDGETPASLFQEVTELKDRASGGDLEVFIAIGGWTFSDNGTDTQPLLGEIAADADKRQTFADNLVDFMVKYGFDGVDLDWEYPGAPDRGGKEADTKNFVSLMKTLRETFDNSARGGYGLTFTIPSSYWYMQYFDVPGLLEYADWTNMMSYDLHGVWDANNEIGNKIHGHTNLTEIKLAVDLLWRNNVPPGKVVLGTGFYGRSFQLSDKDCAEPGCSFKGAARAGECTGEGGILGYFEIQEILRNDDSIKKIHDKETAVNYFTYDDDQWVSYDDEKTFQQKVEWADDLGLGGVMIWAVDMDDDSLTALAGLLGREVGGSVDLPGGIGNIGLVIDDWASQNGQNCEMLACGKKCSGGNIEVGQAKDDCDGDEHRKICCPNSNVPVGCRWRGTSSGSGCKPHCNLGELGLFQSEYGDEDCFLGRQQFCCTSDQYEELVGSCTTTKCGTTKCPSGKKAIATFHDHGADCDGPDPDRLVRSVCCDEDGQLGDCRWTKCHNLQCYANEVLVTTAHLSNIFCRGPEEARLCCKVEDSQAFLPVQPEKIFPELPPYHYDYVDDGQNLDNTYGGVHTSLQTTSELVIAGPPDVVSNLDKRDGSHTTFLSCEGIHERGLQTARIACMNDGEDSNCDDMLLNGLEGTIVKMPKNCGPGTYAVARSLEVSQNQSLPDHVLAKRDSTRPVMDLSFDYNFEKIKRADDKVYIRLDYANVYRYWEQVFAGNPVRRSLNPDLNPRFWSEDEDEWKKLYGKLTEKEDDYYTELPREIDASLYGTSKTCHEGDEQFLKLDVEGSAGAKAKYGFTMVGTLDPWDIQESYAFLGADIQADLKLSVTANTGLNADRIVEELWQTPLRMQRFYEPGIASIAPQFRVFAGVEAGDVGLVGDFSTQLRGGTDGYMWSYFPEAAGERRGKTQSKISKDAFDGEYKVTKGSFTVTFEPRVDLDISIGKYVEMSDGYAQTKNAKRGWEASSNLASTELSLWFEMGLQLDGYKAVFQQSEGFAQAMNYGGDHDLFPEDDESQYLIGKRPDAYHLKSPTRDLDGPKEPDYSGYPIFGGHDLLECASGLGEDTGKIPEAVCLAGIADADPKLLEDGGEPSMKGTELGNGEDKSLDPRGNPRPYDIVDLADQVLFTIWCLSYPSIGRLPWSPGDPMMDVADPDGCTEVGVTDDGDPNMEYVTEHIFELQSIAQFISFAIHGRLPDGSQTQHSTISQATAERLDEDYGNWAGNNAPAESALYHIFNAIGSNNNKGAMIRCEAQLNAVKGRLWSGIDIIADSTWDGQGLDDPDNAHMALSWLREAGNIFAYLEADEVQDRLQETVDSIREELERFQDLYNANQSSQIDIVSLWDEWIISFFEDMRDRAASWVRRRAATIVADWEDIVRSRRRDYNADPNPENQVELEAAEENLKIVKETVDGILDRIRNTTFWDWLT
ncbi:uncharacterized protein BJX67DRAFT_338240 [Aspergillus lucknowensis]|uniref:chitinase n=1 Tax=Aspergillus lucknowensis TaxID=176173 RepID=A0ABR4L8S0_9EURO